MRISLRKMFILSGFIFMLAACGDVSSQVEDQIETLEESSLQQDLQSLINYENQLQEDFEDSLDGEDMSDFTDSSAVVYSNIDSRSALLDSLDEYNAEYETIRQNLEDISYSEEDADIEEIVSSMTDHLEGLNRTLSSFIPQYGEVLDSEREYFHSIGESSADYEIFSSGFENVNEQHESLNEFYYSLDDTLTNLEADKNQMLEILGEAGES